MKSKTQIIFSLWKNGSSIQEISKLLDVPTKHVYNAIRTAPDVKHAQKRRKSQKLPELVQPIGHLHNPYSKWEAKHKPPIGKCVAWVVENGKAKQCGKPAKRQLCSDCQHKTLPVGNTLGRRVYG
jgi:hypothetical protein